MRVAASENSTKVLARSRRSPNKTLRGRKTTLRLLNHARKTDSKIRNQKEKRVSSRAYVENSRATLLLAKPGTFIMKKKFVTVKVVPREHENQRGLGEGEGCGFAFARRSKLITN